MRNGTRGSEFTRVILDDRSEKNSHVRKRTARAQRARSCALAPPSSRGKNRRSAPRARAGCMHDRAYTRALFLIQIPGAE